MESFSLIDPNNFLLKRYATYGKASGLLLAYKMGLPVSTNGWICASPLDAINQADFITKDTKLLCRPDAPIGHGNNLPQGKDLYFGEIHFFCGNVQKICKNAVILVFPPPSIQLTGKFIPRYQISGGLIAVIDKVNGDLLVEYVGRGFDVGDLTRGKHIHTSISIPLEELNREAHYLFKLNKENLIGKRYDITQEKYNLSRDSRIHELNTKLDTTIKNFEEYIPLDKQTLNFPIFQKLLKECIYPVFYSRESIKLGKIYEIMLNLYDSKFYVFEIWKPIRNIPR